VHRRLFSGRPGRGATGDWKGMLRREAACDGRGCGLRLREKRGAGQGSGTETNRLRARG